MSLEIILTEDGSNSIKNTIIDECYHSTSGAIDAKERAAIDHQFIP